MKCIISSTNRKDSNSFKLSKILLSYYEKASEEAQILNLSEDVLWSELTGDKYLDPPQNILDLEARMKKTDGWLFVVPEYNGGIPGCLKHFIDHLPITNGLFGKKPVSLVGISESHTGAIIPLDQLSQILNFLGCYVHSQKTYIPNLSQVFKNDKLTDLALEGRLKRQIQSFQEFTRLLGA